ncbi:hypothetical protein F4778DRAFT_724510 [Xylariomycetidae sp. FL2044]|nr:hypothetical protein F4778DRAFT_724510 [Xylariomycetidae sp. FL2044]
MDIRRLLGFGSWLCLCLVVCGLLSSSSFWGAIFTRFATKKKAVSWMLPLPNDNKSWRRSTLTPYPTKAVAASICLVEQNSVARN